MLSAMELPCTVSDLVRCFNQVDIGRTGYLDESQLISLFRSLARVKDPLVVSAK
jgi:hypothetical protein